MAKAVRQKWSTQTWSGFTLIELMIVVAIIGLLAAIAIPNFVKFQCRSKQAEAKTNLKALYSAQESYRAEFDRYMPVDPIGADANNPNVIGFQPVGRTIRYGYAAETPTPLSFIAGAHGRGQMLGDHWIINHRNHLGNVANTCQ